MIYSSAFAHDAPPTGSWAVRRGRPASSRPLMRLPQDIGRFISGKPGSLAAVYLIASFFHQRLEISRLDALRGC